MISALVLAVLALAHLAPATEVPPERCGAPDPSRAQLSAAAELSFQESVDRREGFRSAMITVNTYFHVVAKSSNEADGYLSVRASPRLCPPSLLVLGISVFPSELINSAHVHPQSLTHSSSRTKPSRTSSAFSTRTSRPRASSSTCATPRAQSTSPGPSPPRSPPTRPP